MKIIDVSRWNYTKHYNIDFNKVRASGVEGVIIKAGGSDDGFYKDPYFERSYDQAKKAGLLVGCYYFVGPYFKSAIDGKTDARCFLDLIKGKQFELPVFIDIENLISRNRETITQGAIAFCEEMENNKYFTGIYGSEVATFNDLLVYDKLCINKNGHPRFCTWVANYSDKVYIKKIANNALIKQYSSKGKVPGVPTNVDLNTADSGAIKDIVNAIKKYGLNNFKAEKSEEPKERIIVLKHGEVIKIVGD